MEGVGVDYSFKAFVAVVVKRKVKEKWDFEGLIRSRKRYFFRMSRT